MARRVDWRGHNLSAVHDWQDADRVIPGPQWNGVELWCGGIAGGDPVVGVLLSADSVFRRGTDEGLRGSVWVARHFKGQRAATGSQRQIRTTSRRPRGAVDA